MTATVVIYFLKYDCSCKPGLGPPTYVMSRQSLQPRLRQSLATMTAHNNTLSLIMIMTICQPVLYQNKHPTIDPSKPHFSPKA